MTRRNPRVGAPRYYGWHPDIIRVDTAMRANNTVQAVVWALMVPCPECARRINETCVLPEDLEHQGIFVHHQRIAEGAKV